MSIQVPTRPFLENKKLNKIEQNKAAKDGLLVGNEIEEFARIGWEEVDETDLQLRLKWYGMFWRPKTPGKFMLRLRSPQRRHQPSSSFALWPQSWSVTARMEAATSQHAKTCSCAASYLNDLPDILKRLKDAGLSSIQSGFDNPRNVTGNPLAGIDPNEIIDTRPFHH